MRSGGYPGAPGSGKRRPMWARTMPAPAPSAAPTSAPAGPPRAAPSAAPPAAPAITATRSSLAGPTLTLTVTFVFVFVTLVCDGLMLSVGLCTATPAVFPILYPTEPRSWLSQIHLAVLTPRRWRGRSSRSSPPGESHPSMLIMGSSASATTWILVRFYLVEDFTVLVLLSFLTQRIRSWPERTRNRRSGPRTRPRT